MRNSVAKAMRKHVGFVPSETRQYSDKNVKTVAVDTGRLDANGNAIINFEQRYIRTSTGARKAYQEIKKFIK